MPATESASRIPSSAAHVQHVEAEGGEDSATVGVCGTTAQEQDVCLELAPNLLTEKTLGPRVHNLLSRPRRMNAVDNVKTYLTMLVSSVL